MKTRMEFAPKDQYYDNFITYLKQEFKKDKTACPRYPSRESFDEDTRKELKEEYPDKVIEGMEKIDGETIAVWYFYDEV